MNKLVIVLLIVSVLGNMAGLYVVYKYMKKHDYVLELEKRLQQKNQVLQDVGEMLPKKIVFLHHSVGGHWLNDGLREELMRHGYSIESITRGNPLGEETDMNHWVPKFQRNVESIIARDDDSKNDIVMFKSCFPNSDITGIGSATGDALSPEKTLANYRAVFDSLKPIFAAHPNQTFIYITAPPLNKLNTNSDNAARARQFNEWIKTEFPKMYGEETGLHNVKIFDLFDVLADNNNVLKAEYVRQESRPNDSHPNFTGNQAATKAFLAFLKSEGLL